MLATRGNTKMSVGIAGRSKRLVLVRLQAGPRAPRAPPSAQLIWSWGARDGGAVCSVGLFASGLSLDAGSAPALTILLNIMGGNARL